jgi:hypothetical protein
VNESQWLNDFTLLLTFTNRRLFILFAGACNTFTLVSQWKFSLKAMFSGWNYLRQTQCANFYEKLCTNRMGQSDISINTSMLKVCWQHSNCNCNYIYIYIFHFVVCAGNRHFCILNRHFTTALLYWNIIILKETN